MVFSTWASSLGPRSAQIERSRTAQRSQDAGRIEALQSISFVVVTVIAVAQSPIAFFAE